jgi:ssDNA-binding Zn-finger/Zn-ribbon topoisomerase 1
MYRNSLTPMTEMLTLLHDSGLFCPDCMGELTPRIPKPGGKRFSPFYGCKKFPVCRGTRTYSEVGYAAVGEDEWEPGDYVDSPQYYEVLDIYDLF